MTGIDLESEVGAVPMWWHSIELRPGIVTPGRKSAEFLAGELDNLQLPDLRGRTVLDVGAWDGFFSFAAERLGAARVVALDHYIWSTDLGGYVDYVARAAAAGQPVLAPHELAALWSPDGLPGKRGFDLVRRTLASHVEPVVADFMKLDLEALGSFDIALYLGVLYHMEDPLGALRRLFAVTRDVAVIETEARVFPGGEVMPLFEFIADDRLERDPTNWWAPNMVALCDLCRAAGFASAVPIVGPPPAATDGSGPIRYRAVVHAYRTADEDQAVTRLDSTTRLRGRSLACGRVEPEQLELPPPELRRRVAGTDDESWFVNSGRMAVADFDAALASIDLSYADFSDVYEFGCGCGRITQHLPARLPSARLSASDIDEQAIEWLRPRLPEVAIDVNPWLPPLPYENGAFDLVIGWSIFTHLPEDYQDAWLAELARVARPGAVVLQTVAGEANFRWSIDNALRAWSEAKRSVDPQAYGLEDLERELGSRGFVFWDEDGWADSFPAFYHTAYHLPRYVRTHWSRWFEILDIRLGGGRPNHDIVVMRRTADRPRAPQPGVLPAAGGVPGGPGRTAELEQRLAASEARLRDAEADRDNSTRRLDAVLTSKSWRGTAPLRALARSLRRR